MQTLQNKTLSEQPPPYGDNKMEWINIKDRFPPINKGGRLSAFDMDGFHPSEDAEGICVLTYSPDWGCVVAVYSHEEECWYDADDVTHWMHLPDAPKEG